MVSGRHQHGAICGHSHRYIAGEWCSACHVNGHIVCRPPTQRQHNEQGDDEYADHFGIQQADASMRSYLPLRITLLAGLAEPVTRGGNPVCWVSRRPLVGCADSLTGTVVEFFLRALW
jgi:hypothetical protein